LKATGIYLELDEVKLYLLIEGLTTYTEIKKKKFKGYDEYFGYQATKERGIR
jgi:hypothetical protein